MASLPDTALIKKGQVGQLNSYLEKNSFIGGAIVSKLDIEYFNIISNGFDKKKNTSVKRWFDYVRQLSDAQLAALPENGEIVISASESEEESGSDSSSGSSSGSDSDSDSDSDDEAAKKQKEKEARWKRNIEKEQSNVVFDVQGAGPDVDMDALANSIRAIERPSLIWGQSHDIIPIAYGVSKLRIGSTITNVQVDVDDLQGELEELEGVRAVEIIAFQKI